MSDGLNPAQRDAVETLAGPLLVLAGAGAGKTRVVTHRIARLIRHGVAPGRILAVTFTKKAAGEMSQRAGALIGKRSKEKPEISTFHSLCVRILRRHAPRLGYPERFAIYDRGDQESVARSALREIRVGDEILKPSDLVAKIGFWKTRGVRPSQATAQAASDKDLLAATAYARYQRALRTAGAMDFDDLLLSTEDLFEQFPDLRRGEAGRFSHLLIDEYQDTNATQYRIVRALAIGHRNLCVVGDDDQSIYGWRGAEVQHILRFKHDWPEAKVVRLEDNYRSTQAILTVANRLIACNRQRHEKVLRAARPGGEKPKILQFQDEELEARSVVADIQSLLAAERLEPRDFAILFRTNEQPRPFEMELRRAKIPYVLVGGQSFYDRKEVRDILAYLKLLAFPHDEVSLRRIINRPARGLGDSTVNQLVAAAVGAGVSLWTTLGGASGMPGVPRAAIAGIESLRALFERAAARLKSQPLSAVANQLVREIDYRQEIERAYKEPADQLARWAAVEEAINAVASYERRAQEPSIAGFLDDITLGDRDSDREKESQLARNAVALMTLHSAKGLEFPHVYMVGMEDGCLPHHRAVAAEGAAVEEERRLCYVGVTRAQERLTLSMALTRMKWGKARPTQPSRFLFEIAGQAERPTDPPKRQPAPHPKGRQSGKPARRRGV